jgi:hypothetical protein
MNLYRIDFDGGELHGAPVVDCLGPVVLRNSRRTLARAAAEAAAHDNPVVITRITGPGYTRRMNRVHPDGRIERIPR